MPKPKKPDTKDRSPWWMSPRMGGLVYVFLGIFMGLSFLGYDDFLMSFLNAGESGSWFGSNYPTGRLGELLYIHIKPLFGYIFAWIIPAWLIVRGSLLILRRKAGWLVFGGRLPMICLASMAWLGQQGLFFSESQAFEFGGRLGLIIAHAFCGLFQFWGSLIVLSFILLTAVLWLVQPWLMPTLRRSAPFWVLLGRVLGTLGESVVFCSKVPVRLVSGVFNIWRGVFSDLTGLLKNRRVVASDRKADPERRKIARRTTETPVAGTDTSEEPEPKTEPRRLHTPEPKSRSRQPARDTAIAVPPVAEEFPEEAVGLDPAESREIVLPDISLLAEPPPEAETISPEALHESADLLENTLRSFGVDGMVKDVRPGPVVTTFEYQPASGVRVNAIVQRSDDLALAMKARSIRMEAPIPGKAAVGIEIPNPVQQIVSLKDVFERAAVDMDKPLTVVLGQDVFGEPVAIDLAAQPHLLVAGSTGSGKSVCINAMITSLLMRCDPSILRLMLIDPKMLELNVYNDIPHLLLPVITDPKESLRALKWLEAQMDHRYRRLAKHSVRNIEGYNRKVAEGRVIGDDGEPVSEPIPYFVCIVDELADLMMQLGQEIELPITRIAQKARAVGIHLVLATQRPSVDVLTGVIKANVPCRIAFRVIQKNDSRTILDANGAEKLLGLGDMLYLQPGRALPIRVHGAFVKIEECEAIAGHWRTYKDLAAHINLVEEQESSSFGTIESDELYDKAREIIVYNQHGSTSMLQRKLGVGYARAGRLMDLLEQAGVVGPFIGSKAREVLMRPDDLQALEAAEGDEIP